MDIKKYVNKKKYTLPPRPKPPTVEQIMHDLKMSSKNDAAFLIYKQQGKIEETNPNMNDSEQVYQLMNRYLETNKVLSKLDDQIMNEESKLYSDMENMKRSAEDFKKQAHDALLR